MKKIIFSVVLVTFLSSYSFAADHSSHNIGKKEDDKVVEKKQKDMSCPKSNSNPGMIIDVSKSIVEDIVEEQLLPKMKGFSLDKVEKSGNAFDVFLKDSNGNYFKLSLIGSFTVNGLIPLKNN